MADDIDTKSETSGKSSPTRQSETAHNQQIEPTTAFLDICKQLDPEIDEDFIEKAWKQYDTVGKQYVLEV
ncbi:hypothetical protein LOAG_15643 [Loa loa]|uniref:Uncharacterized protein n=1 Tax=Loa loa TaxID=7209 RepID=A0A1S0TFU1_LOALO|nr:hypothetical protein LOAG_15643 [Loa loa]EFO12889.2 hypothetical protein LOAG_15643 [Loa loa]